MRGGVEHLTQAMPETNITSLEEVPKASLWTVFQSRGHTCQTRS